MKKYFSPNLLLLNLIMTSLSWPLAIKAAVVVTSNDQTGTGNGQDVSSVAHYGNGKGGLGVVSGAPNLPGNGPGDGGKTGGGLDTAYMTVNVDTMTKEDWMPFICQGLPDNITDCQGVQDLQSYLTIHGHRILRAPTAAEKRKRRGASDPFWSNLWQDFGTGVPSFPSLGFDPWQPFQPPAVPPTVPPAHPEGYQDPSVPSSPVGGSVACPTPLDQSAVYKPVSDDTGYPAGAIGEEVNDPQNLPLRNCLSLEVVTTLNGPQPVAESFRETAVPTCPSQLLRLWRYTSVTQGECWVMQNFGDLVLYRTCPNKFCSNCRDDRWSFTSGFEQKLCLSDYRAVTMWAYCPANDPGFRIVRDRVVVPVTCTCQAVKCPPLT